MYFVEINTIEKSRLLDWVRIFGSSEEKTAYAWALNLRSGFSSIDTRPSVRIMESPSGKLVEIWR